MAVSTATANAMLGGLPSTLYVQLHSGDPGASGTANVLAGPGRGTVSIPAASGGQRAVSANVDVPGVPASATVSHVSYWDAASGGTFQMSQPLGVSVSFLYAGTLRFTSQVFTLSTSTGSSQTQTSVTTDATTGTETVVTRSIARVTDTSSSSDSTVAFSGVGASDSGSFTETVTLKFSVVVSDTSSTSEVVSDSQSAPSDTTAPVVTDFTVGTPSGLTVTIATFTATDAVGVTGYKVTTSATPPGVGDAGWTGTAPLTWTASSAGTYSLYPWAKDSAGNVSSVFGSPRSVTVSDASAPTQSFILSAGAADASEYVTTAYNGTNGTLTATAFNLLGAQNSKGVRYYYLGIGWSSLTVPAGISQLKIKLKVQGIGTPATLYPIPLKIHAVAAAPNWGAGMKPSTATVYGAVEWTLDTSSLAVGSWITTPDLASLLAASGWTSGQSLSFVFRLSDTNGSGAGTPLGNFLANYYPVGCYRAEETTEADRPVLMVWS